ncbi:MAG: right-handed parallel beta-helix repeat-containing protein, partial [Thermoplasmata archaeon]
GVFLEHFNSHLITGDNMVNGQQLYYFKDTDGIFIDGIPMGELILANCTNWDVRNLNISNTDVGIEVAFSSGISITNNNISSNNHGIYLYSSSDNDIYHNHILNNAMQGYDNTNQSRWNDSYPSGGNYWSDYDGIDEYQGPGQDVPGSDGIGDTPYMDIRGDSGARDFYPLLYPMGNFIFLYEGWNLISLPFVQSDTDLGAVLSSISGSYQAVQWYDANTPDDQWKHNRTTKPPHLNDLHSLDHLIGFWIFITEPGGVLFEYFGAQPVVNQPIALYPGWNLVGFPSLSNKNRTAALNNLTFGVEVDSVWTHDPAAKKWEEIGPLDSFELCRGYWIHATQECVWEVPL